MTSAFKAWTFLRNSSTLSFSEHRLVPVPQLHSSSSGRSPSNSKYVQMYAGVAVLLTEGCVLASSSFAVYNYMTARQMGQNCILRGEQYPSQPPRLLQTCLSTPMKCRCWQSSPWLAFLGEQNSTKSQCPQSCPVAFWCHDVQHFYSLAYNCFYDKYNCPTKYLDVWCWLLNEHKVYIPLEQLNGIWRKGSS